jgi:hypothetical protein
LAKVIMKGEIAVCIYNDIWNIDPSQAEGGVGHRGNKVHQNGAAASQLWYSCRRFEQLAGITRSKKVKLRAAPPPLIGQFVK